MNMTLPLREYLQSMRPYANHELTLEKLFEPFGISASREVFEDLLVGFVVDDLVNEFNIEDDIDIVDVALAAYELGCTEAKVFFEFPFAMVA